MLKFKKYYIYIIELILGNIIFNFTYSIIKTVVFKIIGASTETFVNNIKTCFSETLILYCIIYVNLVAIQILYDKSIVHNLNNKLHKINEKGGIQNEE